METKLLVLEYFKLAFSPAAISALLILILAKFFNAEIKALINRIAKIKFPGGGELETSQIEKAAEAPTGKSEPPKPIEDSTSTAYQTQDPEKLRQIYLSEKARSYLWEYRYLNYFLARHTQQFLDWIAGLANPITIALADSYWLPTVPNSNERKAVLDAVEMHHLVKITNGLIEITPKGKEYIQWRGPLPPQPN